MAYFWARFESKSPINLTPKVNRYEDMGILKFLRIDMRPESESQWTGTSPQPRHERTLWRNVDLENTLEMTERSPTASVRRISDGGGATRIRMWRKLHDFCLYPFHLQTVQAIQTADFVARVEFCHWLLGNLQLYTEILFTDEAKFNWDGMVTWSSHVRSFDNPHACANTRFQSRFSVNVWCDVFGSQVIGPSVLEECLISEHYFRFLEDKLPVSDVPLHIRQEPCLQQDGAPPRFGRQVTAFLSLFQNSLIGPQVPVAWPPVSPDLIPLDHYLWGRMKSLLNWAVESHSGCFSADRRRISNYLIKLHYFSQ
jgi:hypothetical protein